MKDSNFKNPYEEPYKVGRDLILEMGENFKPYLKIMLDQGIKNITETTVLFGLYIMSSKKDSKGYNIISTNSFLTFLYDFKENESN